MGFTNAPLRWLPVREVTKLFSVILMAHNQRSIEPDAVVENDKYGRRDIALTLMVWEPVGVMSGPEAGRKSQANPSDYM